MSDIRTIAAAFIIEDGNVLLVHSVKHGLRIEPPGGKVEDGETLEEACIREVKEELDITINLGDVFTVNHIDTPEGEFVMTVFLATIKEGTPRGDCEPQTIDGFKWYSYDELVAMKDDGTLVPDVTEALEELKGLLAR